MDENEPIQPLQQHELEDHTDPNWELDPIDTGPGKDFSFFFHRSKTKSDGPEIYSFYLYAINFMDE